MRFSRITISVIVLILCLSAQNFGQGTPSKAVASEDNLKILLGKKVLLDAERDGFMHVHKILYAPGGKHFIVIGCGFECTDNIGFLFAADGTRRRDFTGRWDQIFSDKLEWSNDSRTFYYYRINSTGADPPRNAPPEGWIAVNVATGRKSSGITRRLSRDRPYVVFDTADGLAVRATPGSQGREVGRLASDEKNVYVTGATRRVGNSVWVQIKSNSVSGWVNQRFLFNAQ